MVLNIFMHLSVFCIAKQQQEPLALPVYGLGLWCLMPNNISVISWRSVL